MDEYDEIGRAAFLEKYGFGEARQYFVRRRQVDYDSKAIVGAAHGFEFPNVGPLRSNDFSGGEATVEEKLEALGFEVVIVGRALEPPGRVDLGQLKAQFHERMVAIYKDAREIGYNATRFLGMLSDHGGHETARILLHATTVSEGYTALWERGRLDLTVEAVILEAPWHPLFTDNDRLVAEKRLRDYGYRL